MQVGASGAGASRLQRLLGYMKAWMLGFIERCSPQIVAMCCLACVLQQSIEAVCSKPLCGPQHTPRTCQL